MQEKKRERWVEQMSQREREDRKTMQSKTPPLLIIGRGRDECIEVNSDLLGQDRMNV